MKYESVIAVFDLETGGLIATENPMCEIAFCPIDVDLKELKEYNSIIAPYDDSLVYTEGALKANGMTMEQIKAGKSSVLVIKELCDYLTSLKRGRNKPILAGHNIKKFDIPFLEAFFKFHKVDLWKFVDGDFWIDTLHWSRLKHIESANFKLGTVCDINDIELVNAHRAVADTRANKELAKKYISCLRSEMREQFEENRYRVNFEF